VDCARSKRAIDDAHCTKRSPGQDGRFRRDPTAPCGPGALDVLDHVVTVLLRCRDKYLTRAPASRATRGKLVVEPGLHVAHRVVEDQAEGALSVGTPNDPKDDRRRANEPGFSPVNSPAA
jgi:hypothetical protein